VTNEDLSLCTESHRASAQCHVVTQYDVKVARSKQQQTSVLSFFRLSQHHNATQENGLPTLENSGSNKKHASTMSSGTVTLRVWADKIKQAKQ